MVQQIGEFLIVQGMPTDVTAITREHVQAFITDVLSRHKPATANQQYRSLQPFFKWLLEEVQITASPMRNMKPPRIPEEPPAVLTEEQLKKLLRTCEGKDLASRPDMAIIRLLLDTGMHRGELAGLTLKDIDFETNIAVVLRKGGRPRVCPFVKKTARPRSLPSGAIQASGCGPAQPLVGS